MTPPGITVSSAHTTEEEVVSFCRVLSLILVLLPAVALGLKRKNGSPPQTGSITVSVMRTDGTWRPAGQLVFETLYSVKGLELTELSPDAVVRLSHHGSTAAHLDSVRLGRSSPRRVAGAGALRAVRKLARSDHDVLDVRGRTITLGFSNRGSGKARLSVRGRFEPIRISEEPFVFPAGNLFRPMTTASEFFSYRLDSRRGTLNIDGRLEEEALGAPFFKTFSRTGTGHPSGFTYGWVKNDDSTLYVALDFIPDNTMDGKKDYAEVYVRAGDKLRRFRVSVERERWGRAGFSYTRRARYQHKVYEFAIPLARIADRRQVELAFAAYGTAAPDQGAPDQGAPTKEAGAVADQGSKKTDTGDSGCDCAVSSTGVPSLVLFGLLLLALRGRSRRRR
jgi:MYXO-CTERM domain-containing protein